MKPSVGSYIELTPARHILGHNNNLVSEICLTNLSPLLSNQLPHLLITNELFGSTHIVEWKLQRNVYRSSQLTNSLNNAERQPEMVLRLYSNFNWLLLRPDHKHTNPRLDSAWAKLIMLSDHFPVQLNFFVSMHVRLSFWNGIFFEATINPASTPTYTASWLLHTLLIRNTAHDSRFWQFEELYTWCKYTVKNS